MRSVGIWGMALEGNKFAKLLEGDEVERFLSAFVLPEDVRKDAQNQAPDIQFPENTDDVLRDVKSIWEKKGFLSPAELRAELIGHLYAKETGKPIAMAEVDLSNMVGDKWGQI